MVNHATCRGWLHFEWLLAASAEHSGQAIAAYKRFVAVEAMQGCSARTQRLSEIPRTQRRPPAKTLEHFARSNGRDTAVCAAYNSDSCTLRQIGE